MTAHDSSSRKTNRIAVLLLLIVISAGFARMFWGPVMAVVEPTFATPAG